MARATDYQSGTPYNVRGPQIEAAKFLQSKARRFVEGKDSAADVNEAIRVWREADDGLLAAFREEIERAWMERGDYSVVDRLAAANPDLTEKLYLFFATVVDAPDLLDLHQPELRTP